jgi:hypothetical protein
MFKNDDQILIDALKRFQSKSGGFFLQSVTYDGANFILGKTHEFPNQKELSHVIWDIPGKEMFIAVFIGDGFNRLTYKGKKFTTTYLNVNSQFPTLDYLKAHGVKYTTPIDFENLDVEVEKLQQKIKTAS